MQAIYNERINLVRDLVRLIGLHSNKSLLQSQKEVSVHNNVFKLITYRCFPGNVAFFVVEESQNSFMKREKSFYNRLLNNSRQVSKHYIVCFNWFDTQSIFDLISLGTKIIFSSKQLDQDFGLFNSAFYQLAKTIMNSFEFKKHVLEKIESDSNCYFTFTGFSMGGVLAQIILFLLRHQGYYFNRSIGIGCPKPGSTEFAKWFKNQNNMEDSFYVVLRSKQNIDNVCSSPKHFPVHPNCFILENGQIKHIDLAEEQMLATGSRGLACSIFDKLHSIKKYYEHCF